MKIGVASDHAGFEYKGKIAALLKKRATRSSIMEHIQRRAATTPTSLIRSAQP